MIIGSFSENVQENRVVDRTKEFSNVELQNPQDTSVIPRQFES